MATAWRFRRTRRIRPPESAQGPAEAGRSAGAGYIYCLAQRWKHYGDGLELVGAVLEQEDLDWKSRDYILTR